MSHLPFRKDGPAVEFLSRSDGRGIALAFLLFAVTAIAWLGVFRADAAMDMSHGPAALSLGGMIAFTTQWGVMMTAMMLPSAAPMILLYGKIGGGAAQAQPVIPPVLFALTYLATWMLTGVPVYAASVAVEQIAARSAAVAAGIPYAIAATLLAAGVYQLTPAKRACLRQCVSPADFLMRRWRAGYAASLRLAATHAAYCIGCCWALMIVLVAAGAMSLAWVLAIALTVFIEKVLPASDRTTRVIGAALILAGVTVAIRPELAAVLRPGGMR